jgi:hypothetical protein
VTGIPEMVRSFSATGTTSVPEKAAAVERLGRAVFDELWDVYGKRDVTAP